jgi:hypothetical protein
MDETPAETQCPAAQPRAALTIISKLLGAAAPLVGCCGL